MINIIVKQKIMPVAQKGKVVKFKRRKPKESILSKKTKSLSELYNHIRMLDAKSYPTAFIKHGNLRIEFKKAKMSQTDRDALQVMELNDETKWEQIHLKFKELVKKYHPDKNQGSKKYEDKLKKITLAYSQLKKTLGKK